MSSNKPSRILRFTGHALRFTCFFIFGLATCRMVYEWAFPQLLWLARPFPTLLLAALIASTSLTLSPFHPLTPSTSLRASLSPLLLNLLYLFDPAVNLIESRLIFFVSIWLTAVLISHRRLRPTPWFGPTFILLGLLPIYLLTMPDTVGRADTFEFQVVAPQLGIAHPTGYPLYLLLSKLFTFIPISSVAWRVNLGTAVFALSALTIIYLIILQLDYRPVPALLGAIAIGLTPTFWSQAIEAEVYALHALIVAVALWFILAIGDWRLEISGSTPLILAFVIGLGLTNHLTTLFLIPAAVLAVLFALKKYGSPGDIYRLLITDHWLLPKLLLAAIAPLTLYAYLPLRWAAVNEDAMGFRRFVDWVIGGRFQGALQWSAWRTDPTRYEVLGRLFLDNWGVINLVIAAVGLAYLFRKKWRTAVLLLITWFGFSFYVLNYYIPDISVFLIPAHIIIGIWWACGVVGILAIGNWVIGRLESGDWRVKPNLHSLISTLLLLPILLPTITHWPQIDRSADEALTLWGTAVLSQPLAANAAILADSEKIAPLYYLQQAEGMRPDLDIMVLPDEAAYRAELDGRIPHQTIYLARFLPGLEGIYHLRAVGPLTEVSTEPITQLPDKAIRQYVDFGAMDLLAYAVEDVYERGKTAVTLYWQTNEPINQQLHIYLRWEESHITKPSQHPANNTYPTNAWRVGEIVPDFHLLPNPISSQPEIHGLQVAVAPPFTPPPQLDWQTVARLDVPATEVVVGIRPLRAQINSTTLTGIHHPVTIRPQSPLPITLTGFGDPTAITYQLAAASESSLPIHDSQFTIDNSLSPFIYQTELDTDVVNGRYHLIAHSPNGAICGWLQPITTSCSLGYIDISGVPLPNNAINYADKIALLDVTLDTTELQAGGQLPLTLQWQSLAAMAQDYTIFIQVLNEQDQIVGQVDAWPLQGTLPTSQWPPSEVIRDPHLIQLRGDLSRGSYRLIIGWYLLADFSRLPILDETGAPIDDNYVVPGLIAP